MTSQTGCAWTGILSLPGYALSRKLSHINLFSPAANGKHFFTLPSPQYHDDSPPEYQPMEI